MAASRSGARPRSLARPRADREAERRKAILRAAVEVFSRKGYQGCRIADVAKEAGVAYGLVYHYFKNKDELLESIFTLGWMGFLQRVQTQVAQREGLEARVRSIVEVAFEAYQRDPRGVKVLILEVGRSPAGGAVNRGQAFHEVIRLAADLFAQAQRDGVVPLSFEPTLCATMLFGAIELSLTAFVMGLVDRSAEALQAAKDQVATTLLRGVLTHPSVVKKDHL